MPAPGVAVSRAALRDSVNRLKSIRKRCGKEDEEDKGKASSGDPFRDRCQAFSADLRDVKETIMERNEGAKKNGQDRTTIEQSQDVNRGLMQLDKDLKDIKGLVDDAEHKLIKENKKGKKAQSTKIVMYERTWKDRQEMHRNCSTMLEAARDMNQQRFGGGSKAGLTKAQEIKLGKTAMLRSQLLAGRAGQYASNDGTTSNVGPDGEMVGMSGQETLEENPETREQMKQLADQDKKINAGLDRLGKGVERLRVLAEEIGTEIDTQNTMLDATDEKVSSQTKQLKNLNKRLKKLVKDTKPFNLFVNVACFMLIIALVGYFLYEFEVI